MQLPPLALWVLQPKSQSLISPQQLLCRSLSPAGNPSLGKKNLLGLACQEKDRKSSLPASVLTSEPLPEPRTQGRSSGHCGGGWEAVPRSRNRHGLHCGDAAFSQAVIFQNACFIN